MVKVSSIMRTAICALALAGASAYAQSAKEVLTQINEYQAKLMADARASGKPINVPEMMASVKAKAGELVKPIDTEKIEGKDAYEWARVFAAAGQHRDVCNLCHKFLATSPSAEQKFDAQNLMIASCWALGEADMLTMTITDMKPVNPAGGQSLAMSTARTYADTIAKSKGLDAALKVLDEVGSKIPPTDVKAEAKKLYDQSVASRPSNRPPATEEQLKSLMASYEKLVAQQEEGARFSVVEKKAELLNGAGRKEDAVKVLKTYIAKISDPKGTVARTDNSALKHIELVGASAPALATERSYGEFKGLDSL